MLDDLEFSPSSKKLQEESRLARLVLLIFNMDSSSAVCKAWLFIDGDPFKISVIIDIYSFNPWTHGKKKDCTIDLPVSSA